MIQTTINGLRQYALAINVRSFLNGNPDLKPVKKEKRMTKTTQLGLMGAVLFCSTALAVAQTVHITEIRIDQIGGDVNEYFELAGDAGESLEGVTYLVIGDTGAGNPANSGIIEFFIDLSGHSINGSGRFLVAEDTFNIPDAPAPDLLLDSGSNELNFENSDNVTHLLVTGFTGELLQDLDLDDNGTLDITPWASELDRIALVEEENPAADTEWHYGPPSVGPEGNFVPGQVYLCSPAIATVCEPSGSVVVSTPTGVGTCTYLTSPSW